MKRETDDDAHRFPGKVDHALVAAGRRALHGKARVG
jgi:hypothetical protein